MEDKILAAIKKHQAAVAALAADHSAIAPIAQALAKAAKAGKVSLRVKPDKWAWLNT